MRKDIEIAWEGVNISDLEVPEEILEQNPTNVVEQKSEGFELEFHKIPNRVVRKLAKVNPYNGVAWLIVFRLYELWFGEFGRNPVELTNGYFKKLKISHHSKSQALKILEEADLIKVTRRERGAPLVTIPWLSRKKGHGR
jgi:hypothetical protein